MSEDLLNLVLQKKIKQDLIRHGKNTNKIRETHIFWLCISNYGEIRQDVVSYKRLDEKYLTEDEILFIEASML